MGANVQGTLTRAKEDTLEAIDRIADRIRLKAHLAGMDVKSEWGRLEPRVFEARQHARDASHEASKALDDLLAALEALAARL